MDGTQLPGEGIHLILPGWQLLQAHLEQHLGNAVTPVQRTQTCSATGELLLPSDGAGGMGKVQRLLTAGTQRIQMNSCSRGGNVVWAWGLAEGLTHHGGCLGAPGASQHLLSEPPWEKKNQISLQKPRNGKTSQ